jgi:hypothetical protein
MAARMVWVSSMWGWLSYAIAVILVVASILRIITPMFFLPEFLFQWTDIAVGLTLAVLVPIWAILLARGGPQPEPAV